MRQPSEFNLTTVMHYWDDSALPVTPTIQSMQSSAKSFSKLDPITCLLTYTNLFGNRSDMIMVTSNATSLNNSGNSLLAYGSQHRNQWLLGSPLIGNSNTFNADQLEVSYFAGGAAQRAKAITQWNVGGFKIDYCLGSQTENAQGECSVDYSFSVMIGTLHACGFPDHMACLIIRIRLLNPRLSGLRLQFFQGPLYFLYRLHVLPV